MTLEVKTYRIELLENMLGTIPKDKEIYKTYIESQKPIVIKEDETITVEEIEEKGWTGFHKDETKGLFILDYLFKGFLKHAGNVMKDIVNVKALKSKITDFVFVAPRRIYLGKMEPDGTFERPLRAQTPQGERVCLARSDYVLAGTQFTVKIGLLKHKELDWAKIEDILSHGMLMGLGQFRNGSFGRFKVIEKSEVEEISYEDFLSLPSLLNESMIMRPR